MKPMVLWKTRPPASSSSTSRPMKPVSPSPGRRAEGWILLETVVALVVATILVGTSANLWVRAARYGEAVTTRLTEQRLRTAAVYELDALRKSGVSPRETAEELAARFPTLAIEADDDAVLIHGERYRVEVDR